MAINPQKPAAKKFVEYWTFTRPSRSSTATSR